MKTLMNATLAAMMVMTLVPACDYGGVEEERVLFNLTRGDVYARIVVPGDEGEDGCVAIDVIPEDGIAVLRNLCKDDQNAVKVQISDELAAHFATAIEMERKEFTDGVAAIQGAGAELLDLPMTVELHDAVKEVKGLVDEAVESQKPEIVAEEEPEPIQTAIAMGADTGYIFGADSTFAALPTKVDILAYQGALGLDLVPGVEAATQTARKVHLFVDDHGLPAKFSDLHELPNVALTDADHDELRNVRSGMGFVIENNVSGGYTYVFVKQASDTKVELEFQAVQ